MYPQISFARANSALYDDSRVVIEETGVNSKPNRHHDAPMKIGRRHLGAAGFLYGVIALTCDVTLANPIDDLINLLRESVKNEAVRITPAYAAMINFESEPNISSSTLWIDTAAQNNDKLKVIKLPIRYEFDLTRSGWKPFAQATLSKLSYEQNLDLSNTLGSGESIDSTWDSYSATLGGGMRIPVSGGWSVLPAIDGGYAHLSNDTIFSGRTSNALIKPAFEGIVSNWSADAWLLNGHLALQYRGLVRKLDMGNLIRLFVPVSAARSAASQNNRRKYITPPGDCFVILHG